MEAHLATTNPGCNFGIKSPRALIPCQHVLDFHLAENSLELNDLPELDDSIFLSLDTLQNTFFFFFFSCSGRYKQWVGWIFTFSNKGFWIVR